MFLFYYEPLLCFCSIMSLSYVFVLLWASLMFLFYYDPLLCFLCCFIINLSYIFCTNANLSYVFCSNANLSYVFYYIANLSYFVMFYCESLLCIFFYYEALCMLCSVLLQASPMSFFLRLAGIFSHRNLTTVAILNITKL